MVSKILTVPLLATLLIAGCGKSNEELINAAVPLALSTAKARDAFVREASATGHNDAIDDFDPQMEARARACAPGYVPSGNDTEATRRAIGNEDCFTAADAKLEQWLGARRVGFLSVMNPIRKVPEQVPAQLSGTDEIRAVDFASDAGVALLAYGKRFQLFDLGTGTAIGTGGSDEYCIWWTLSANGRIAYCRAKAMLYAYVAETGELLLALPNYNGNFPVHVVADRGLVYSAADAPSMRFLDFGTGNSSAFPVSDHGIDGLIPIPGEELAFAVIMLKLKATVNFEEGDDGLVARVSGESESGGFPIDFIRPEALVGDTVYYSGIDDWSLLKLKLPLLELQKVSLKPFDVAMVVPTADPDKLLLFLRSGQFGQDWFQYSQSNGQLARLQLKVEGRIRYISTLKANAWFDGTRLMISKGIPAGQAMSASTQAAMLESESEPGWATERN